MAHDDSAYLYYALARAEKVAAKLVEVICDQEHELQQWHRVTADATYALAQERDAARAEVRALLTIRATLEGEVARFSAELRHSRAGVAALRAKVEGLTPATHEAATDAYRTVLAPLDELSHPLAGYDPVPGLVARGVMSDEHDPESCEADCCLIPRLRAKVEALPVFVTDMHNGTGPHYYEHTVLVSEVFALLDGEVQP